jgi:hypothetical protein
MGNFYFFLLANFVNALDQLKLILDDGCIKSSLECNYVTSRLVGVEMRMIMHLLLSGSIIRLEDSQQRIILQVLAYFSIVRRRACWASLVRFSASFRITTAKVESNMMKLHVTMLKTFKWFLINII